jgi:metal-sulfur cluster biosynthetic enzyme
MKVEIGPMLAVHDRFKAAPRAMSEPVKPAGDLEERIRRGLAGVIDPELGVNIVDLGLVYRLDVAADRVEVVLTMTSAACPLGAQLASEAEAAVRRHAPEVRDVEVRLVLYPPWSPDLMSDAARRQLGWND